MTMKKELSDLRKTKGMCVCVCVSVSVVARIIAMKGFLL